MRELVSTKRWNTFGKLLKIWKYLFDTSLNKNYQRQSEIKQLCLNRPLEWLYSPQEQTLNVWAYNPKHDIFGCQKVALGLKLCNLLYFYLLNVTLIDKIEQF